MLKRWEILPDKISFHPDMNFDAHYFSRRNETCVLSENN